VNTVADALLILARTALALIGEWLERHPEES
jgi:hypothetical protein